MGIKVKKLAYKVKISKVPTTDTTSDAVSEAEIAPAADVPVTAEEDINRGGQQQFGTGRGSETGGSGGETG